MKRLKLCAALLVGAAFGTSPAFAALTTYKSFSGNIGYSSDGFGSTSSGGTISANVPVGSEILGAYLYTSLVYGASATATYSATLAGSNVTFQPVVSQSTFPNLGSARADVTSIIKPLVDGGAGGTYDFSITEGNTGLQDGEALFVIYKNSSLGESSFGLLDGFSNVGGDSTSINFADPLDPTQASFGAEMVLGIGFSAGGQSSNVRVNGTLITSQAGNNDDGAPANGALITVGGFNDPYSPLLPSYADDHERYNIAPYITKGDTSINVATNNPSNDDNIFVAGFFVSGRAGFNEPPPPVSSVPEPSTYALMGLGLIGIVLAQRRRRNEG